MRRRGGVDPVLREDEQGPERRREQEAQREPPGTVEKEFEAEKGDDRDGDRQPQQGKHAEPRGQPRHERHDGDAGCAREAVLRPIIAPDTPMRSISSDSSGTERLRPMPTAVTQAIAAAMAAIPSRSKRAQGAAAAGEISGIR